MSNVSYKTDIVMLRLECLFLRENLSQQRVRLGARQSDLAKLTVFSTVQPTDPFNAQADHHFDSTWCQRVTPEQMTEITLR